MNAGVLIVLLTLGPVAGILLFLVFWLITHPETAQRWGEILFALGAKVRRRWDRRAVQLGLQHNIDRFSRKLAGEIGRPKPPAVRVQWTDASEEQIDFFEDNRLVLRMHEHERQDRNLVTASLLIVSETMVRRAKRFLSKTQARATDLYAVDRLLADAPQAQELFHEEIMGPEADASSHMRELIESFQRMDRQGLFFPVYVRELKHLGSKVVVAPRDERLITDVEGLVEFLVKYTDRRIGELMQLELVGNTLRCAIMIVASRHRVESGTVEPLLGYVDGLARRGIETLYLIGSSEPPNKEFLQRVAQGCCGDGKWREVESRTYRSSINVPRPDGSIDVKTVGSQMIVLRRGGADLVGEAA